MGPLQPETMGLTVTGSLCNFRRKYILCVSSLGGGSRNSAVGRSMTPESSRTSTYLARLFVISGVGS